MTINIERSPAHKNGGVMVETEVLKTYKIKREKKTKLKEELRLIDNELGLLEGQIIDSFIELGIGSIEIDGKRIATSKTIWARVEPGMKEKAKEMLEEMNLTSMISFNYQSLSAYIREIVQSGEDLPEEFKGIIGYYEKMGLRLTK